MHQAVVVVNVQHAGPSTGVPTKTEQGDLNQALGANQGDFPRIIMAPTSLPDGFTTPALAFNLADRYQCPVMGRPGGRTMSDGRTFKLIATVKQGTANSPLTAIPCPTLEEAPTGARQLLRDDRVLRVMIVINDVPPRFAEWVER